MENIQDKIAKRAFELFEARGGQHGYHIEDWLQAEKDVREGTSAPKKKSAAKAPAAARVKKVDEPKSTTTKAPATRKTTAKKATAKK